MTFKKINHAKDIQVISMQKSIKIKGDLINVMIPHVHGPEK